MKREQSQSERSHVPADLWKQPGRIACELIGELERERSAEGFTVRRATRAWSEHGFRGGFVRKLEAEGETLLTLVVTGLLVLVGLVTAVLLGIWVVISAT